MTKSTKLNRSSLNSMSKFSLKSSLSSSLLSWSPRSSSSSSFFDSIPPILGIILVIITSVLAQPNPNPNDLVPHMSMKFPIDIHQIDSDFEDLGMALPAGDGHSFVLQTGNPGRLAYLFSKYPMQSGDFEVNFSFTARGGDAGGKTPHKEGFAFWYTNEPLNDIFSERFKEIMRDPLHIQTNALHYVLKTNVDPGKAPRDFIGYSSKFKGFGLFFLNKLSDYTSGQKVDKFEPGIVGAVNDGTKSVFTDMDVAEGLVKKINYRNHGGVPGKDSADSAVKVKVRFSSTNGVKAEVLDPTTGSWTVVFEDSTKVVEKGGHLGFTTYTRDMDPGKADPGFDTWRLWEYNVFNYDPSVTLTTTTTTPEPLPQASHGHQEKDFIYEHSSHKLHSEESQAIHQLTNMVMKLISETEPLRGETERTLKTLANRISSLEKIFVDLKKEINTKTGHDLDSEFNAIKNEILSLSQATNTAHSNRNEKLNQLHDHLTETGVLNNDHHDMLEKISSSWKWSAFLSIGAVIMIIFFGFVLYHRFRVWEKKHIL